LPDEHDHVSKCFPELLTAPLSAVRERTDLAFWELSMWSCLLSVDAAVPLVAHLADVQLDVAFEWRHRVLEVELRSEDRWIKWALSVPSTLNGWATAQPGPDGQAG